MRGVDDAAYPLARDGLGLESLQQGPTQVQIIFDQKYVHAPILRWWTLRFAKG